MVPLLLHPVDGTALPDGIAKYDWISFQHPRFVEVLIEALETDLEWLDDHTRLLVKAAEWDDAERDRGLLLRGRELKRIAAVVDQHDEAASPAIVAIQREYLAASAQHRHRVRRRLLGAGLAALLVAGGLGIVAVTQSQRAEQQTTRAEQESERAEEQTMRAETEAAISRSVDLAAHSSALLNDNIDLSVMLALAAVEESRTPEAMQALAAARKGHRGLGLLGVDEEEVEAVVISPDLRFAATSGSDGVEIWSLVSDDPATYHLPPPQRQESGPYGTLAFSHDSTRFMASAFGSACVWDVPTFSEIGCYADEFGSLDDATLDPTGRLLAGVTTGGVRIYAVDSGEVFLLQDHENEWPSGLAFSSDGRRLLVTRFDGTAAIHGLYDSFGLRLPVPPVDGDGSLVALDGFFSPGDEYVLVEFEMGPGRNVLAVYDQVGALTSTVAGSAELRHDVSFDQEGRYAVVTRRDEAAQVVELSTGRVVRTLTAPERDTSAAEFAGGGPWVLSTGIEGWVLEHPWDERALVRMRALEGWIWEAAVSDDGSLAVVAEDNGSVQVYDMVPASGEVMRSAHAGAVDAVAFNPDGSLVATGGGDGAVRIWTTDTAELLFAEELGEWVYDVKFVRDSLVAVPDDGRLHVWDAGGNLRYVTNGHPGLGDLDFVSDIAVGEDGSTVATVATNGTLQVADVDSSQAAVWQLPPEVVSPNVVALAPDSRVVAVGDEGGAVLVVSDGEVLQSLRVHDDAVLALEYVDDGTVVSGSLDGRAMVIDLASGAAVNTVDHHGAVVTDVAVSPDGRQFATATDDGTVAVWSVQTGEAIRSFSEHSGYVNEVRFSGDGRCVISAAEDGSAQLYHLEEGLGTERIQADSGDVRNAAIDPSGLTLAVGTSDGMLVLSRCVTCAGIDEVVEEAWALVPGDFRQDEITAFFDGTISAAWTDAFDAHRP